MMNSIFQYQSAHRYLLDFVSFKQSSDAAFSLRKWSRQMDLNSHALLVMILQGKRKLSLRHVPALSKGLELSSPERLYFQALIQYENASSAEEKSLCMIWLAEANPGSGKSIKEVDEYMAISHWVHMAILAMCDNHSFSGTPEEIHRRLGGKISLAEVRSAVARLFSLGLLTVKDGKTKSTFNRVTTKDDISSAGARVYHKQVAQMAIAAVDNQAVTDREFQSFAVSISRKNLNIAKEMIRKFRTQLYQAMTLEPGDEVYQTQIQFFRLTESPSEIVPTEDCGAVSSPRTG